MISENMRKKAWDIKKRIDNGEKVSDEELEYASTKLKKQKNNYIICKTKATTIFSM